MMDNEDGGFSGLTAICASLRIYTLKCSRALVRSPEAERTGLSFMEGCTWNFKAVRHPSNWINGVKATHVCRLESRNTKHVAHHQSACQKWANKTG